MLRSPQQKKVGYLGTGNMLLRKSIVIFQSHFIGNLVPRQDIQYLMIFKMVHCSVWETLVFRISYKYLLYHTTYDLSHWVDSDGVEHVLVLRKDLLGKINPGSFTSSPAGCSDCLTCDISWLHSLLLCVGCCDYIPYTDTLPGGSQIERSVSLSSSTL